MSKIVVRTVANPSLYAHIREGIERETSHRTASGAARAYLKAYKDADHWTECNGQWGHIEVLVDGDKGDDGFGMDNADALHRAHEEGEDFQRGCGPSYVERAMEEMIAA